MDVGKMLSDIIDYGMDERFDKVLLQDIEYRKLCRQVDEVSAKLNKQKIDSTTAAIIDDLVDAHAKCSLHSSRAAYYQGLIDGVRLLKELGVFTP